MIENPDEDQLLLAIHSAIKDGVEIRFYKPHFDDKRSHFIVRATYYPNFDQSPYNVLQYERQIGGREIRHLPEVIKDLTTEVIVRGSKG